MKYIAFAILFAVPLTAKSNPILLKDINVAQNDEWSCGAHSTHRLLHNYELSDSYENIKYFIGRHRFKYSLSKTVTQTVEVQICNRLPWPLKKACKWTTKTVERVTTIQVPLSLEIGKGLYQLKDRINAWGINAVAREKMSVKDIENLIDQKKPVITLLQLDTDSKLGIKYPILHWTITAGYDKDNILYYNTDSDRLRKKSRGQFFKEWDWENNWNKKTNIVHAHLTRNEGLEIRSIIYLNDEYIDRYQKLKDLEARVKNEVPGRFRQVESSLNSSAARDVPKQAKLAVKNNEKAAKKVDEVYDSLNKWLTEEELADL